MKLSTVFLINAIFAGFGGFGLVVMPAALMAPYGPELNTAGIFVAQLLGVTLLGTSYIYWATRNVKDRPILYTLSFGAFCIHLAALVLGLWSYQIHALNNMIFVDVFLHGLLAGGFGYYGVWKKV
ncbi:MAG: hypothetical protein HYT10_01465 [Candidatus Levybacteria bacterium]|nr:hypothetical protein [Candidatus Levybacteria bacterium]